MSQVARLALVGLQGAFSSPFQLVGPVQLFPPLEVELEVLELEDDELLGELEDDELLEPPTPLPPHQKEWSPLSHS